MPRTTLTIRSEVGLHARPASLFVRTANQYTSSIHVTCDGREANAKSILEILTVGAGHGAVVSVEAEGQDAHAALKALRNLVESDCDLQA